MHAFGAQIGGFGVCACVQKWCEGVQPPEHLRNTMIQHCATHAQKALSFLLDTGLVQALYSHYGCSGAQTRAREMSTCRCAGGARMRAHPFS